MYYHLSVSAQDEDADDAASAVAPPPSEAEREPLIDSMLVQKKCALSCAFGLLSPPRLHFSVAPFVFNRSEELTRAVREAALKQKMESVDLEKT